MIRIVLMPLAWIYGFITFIRNKLYDIGVYKSKKYPFPIISVGNLVAGGSGKTPHVEYCIGLLADIGKIVVLSRGYGRKTKGFLYVSESSTADEVGDEPLQCKKKFPHVVVVVDGNRRRALDKIFRDHPDLKVVILDDAFQHRAVLPGLSILLTDYRNLYYNDFLLPVGRLREYSSGASRADIIIVTKSPMVVSPLITRDIENNLKLKSHQQLFFSGVNYGRLRPVFQENTDGSMSLRHFYSIFMVSGIANPYPMQEHLYPYCNELNMLSYPDHHYYTSKDITKIIDEFNNGFSRNRVMITTEKDAMRFQHLKDKERLNGIPFYYLSVDVVILREEKEMFDNIIREYVKKNRRDGALS